MLKILFAIGAMVPNRKRVQLMTEDQTPESLCRRIRVAVYAALACDCWDAYEQREHARDAEKAADAAWAVAQPIIDSARDRFIRMEGRHEVSSQLLRGMARRVGEFRRDLVESRLHSDAAWRHVDYVQQLAKADRERLAAINAQQSDEIADLKHALASAATPLGSRLSAGTDDAWISFGTGRAWIADDPEPDDVGQVRDSAGDVWTRNLYGAWTMPESRPAAWWYIAKRWGPLTEVIGGDS